MQLSQVSGLELILIFFNLKKVSILLYHGFVGVYLN